MVPRILSREYKRTYQKKIYTEITELCTCLFAFLFNPRQVQSKFK